jgi:hemin uptake protein HemP
MKPPAHESEIPLETEKETSLPQEPARLGPETYAEGSSRTSWRSEELLGTRDEVSIVHNNETYRLRRTRHGKLILYK